MRKLLIFLLIFVISPLVIGKNNIRYINSPDLMTVISSNNTITIVPVSRIITPVDLSGNVLNYYYDNGLLYVLNNGKPFKLTTSLYHPMNDTIISHKYNSDNLIFNTNEEDIHFTHRSPIIIISNSNESLSSYQVKIVLNSSWDGWNYVKPDGSDIRFSDNEGNYIPYWIEKWDYTNKNAIIWVKVPFIPENSSTTIYIYYGNSTLTSESDPNSVFISYTDFTSDPKLVFDYKNNNGATFNITSIKIPSMTKITVDMKLEVRSIDKDHYGTWIRLFVDEGPVIIFTQDLDYTSNPPIVRVGNKMSKSVSWSHFDLGTYLVTFKRDDIHTNLYMNGTLIYTSDEGDNTPITTLRINVGGSNHQSDTIEWLQNIGALHIKSHRSDTDGHIDIYIYWVRFRKYSNEEPSIVIGNDETGNWIIKKVSVTPKNISLRKPIALTLKFKPVSLNEPLELVLLNSTNTGYIFTLTDDMITIKNMYNGDVVNQIQKQLKTPIIQGNTYYIIISISNNVIVNILPTNTKIVFENVSYQSFNSFYILDKGWNVEYLSLTNHDGEVIPQITSPKIVTIL